jgi:hypothetical protein
MPNNKGGLVGVKKPVKLKGTKREGKESNRT